MKSRFELLRNRKDWSWDQLAACLGLSVSMLMMVRRGDRNLSRRAIYRLEQAEIESGIKSKREIEQERIDSLAKSSARGQLREHLTDDSRSLLLELEDKLALLAPDRQSFVARMARMALQFALSIERKSS